MVKNRGEGERPENRVVLGEESRNPRSIWEPSRKSPNALDGDPLTLTVPVPEPPYGLVADEPQRFRAQEHLWQRIRGAIGRAQEGRLCRRARMREGHPYATRVRRQPMLQE